MDNNTERLVAGQIPKTPEGKAKLDFVKSALRAAQEGGMDTSDEAIVEDEEPTGIETSAEPSHEKPVSGVPEWFEMPEDISIEPGTEVRFVRMKAALTAKPTKGDRQCLLTILTVQDERLAYQRASRFNDKTGGLTIAELAKQTIRVIDGKKADWSGRSTPASVEAFWKDIGRKYRARLEEWYLKAHAMTEEEKLDFFGQCVEDRVWT